jgi:hypothetical protein
MDGQIKFIIVKTKDQGMFITDNIKGENYFSSKLEYLFFDGEKLVATYKKHWYKLNQLPTKIEKMGASTQINRRYELKAGFPVSDLTPQTIKYEDWDSDSEISGLYTYTCENVEGVLEDVGFEYEILSEEDGFYVEKPKYTATPNLIVSLTTHPDLYTQRPCSVDGKELYRIIRNHIKANINPRYAKITSDYDFCLTVEKVIACEPEKYTVNTGTSKRLRYETRYKRERTVKVFETSPEGYSNYPKQKGIDGRNQKDLEDKIDAYLEEIMLKINEPYVECSHCKGLGVVLENSAEKK